MFKLTRSGGLRRASGGGAQTPRIRSPFNKFHPMPAQPQEPPFTTLDPRDHGRDSKNTRVSEPGEGTGKGYTGANIGA